MALNPSNSSNLDQLALKGLRIAKRSSRKVHSVALFCYVPFNEYKKMSNPPLTLMLQI